MVKRLGLYKNDSEMLNDGISIIICCYNSEWIIARCLDALKQQRFSTPLEWEIIVVDNACTDETTTIVGRYSKELPLRIVFEPEPGLLNARKRGISVAKYQYSIFCDDDNILCPNYVYGMYQLMSSNLNIGCAGGRGVAEFMCEPDEIVYQFLKGYAIGSQKDLVYLYGAGICVRTDVVKEIYNTEHFYLSGRCGNRLLAGDDTELVISILTRGYQETCSDDLTFKHVLPAQRLKYDYLKGMLKGFGLSAPILRAKGHAEKGRPFRYIYLTYVKCLLNVFRYGFVSFFSPKNCIWYYHYFSMINAFKYWSFETLRKAYNSCVYR